MNENYVLLTQDEEIQLANLVIKGQEALQKLESNNYLPSEKDSLHQDVVNGQGARDRLVLSNQKLAYHIAKDYVGRGVDYNDLCQEALMGLVKAADKFRPGHNAKFSTYASNWIKESIRDSITNNSKFIRLPKNVFQKVNKYKRTVANLEADLQRDPTIAEIATAMKVSEDEILDYMELSKSVSSLDKYATEDKDATYGELIPDNVSLNPYQKSMKNRLSNKLYEALHENLSDDEIFILDEHIGLTTNKKKSFEEIAPLMNLSRERVRQIYNNSLEKLRNCPQARDLKLLMQAYE